MAERSTPSTASRRRTAAAAAVALAAGLTGWCTVPASAADAPALALGHIADIKDLPSGGTAKVPVSVINKGQTEAKGAILHVQVSYGLKLDHAFSNCEYIDNPASTKFGASRAICVLDETLAPGTAYAASQQLPIGTESRALNENTAWSVAPYSEETLAQLRGTAKPAKGTGPALKLVEQSTKPREHVGHSQYITVKNTADMSVTGATLSGKAGDIVTAGLTVTNKGPGWTGYSLAPYGSFDPVVELDVTPPPGTTALTDDACQRGKGTTVICKLTTWDKLGLVSGDSHAFPLKLRIDKVVENATGSVTFRNLGVSPEQDPNKANNSTRIVLNGTGDTTGGTSDGGTTTGGSSSGGSTSGTTGTSGSTGSATSGTSGSTSSSGASGTSGTSGTTGSAGSTGSTTAAGTTGTSGSTGSTTGGLAATGSDNTVMLGAAAASLVAAGGAVFAVARRRRAHSQG
ncbi:hypothetical protein [Streptomyces sp. NRRL S-118]|uniref:hypothetical protein n=1 Tax=Streptomyces sp. NRRL S-118 TaxID=1463881 RepID=UPI0004C6F701|nr:hypothetical protein [Streptomyces sp. NRRL S-118]